MSQWKTIWDHEIAPFGQRLMRFAGGQSPCVIRVDEVDQDNIVVIHDNDIEPDTWSILVKEEANGIVRISGMTGSGPDDLTGTWFQLLLSSPAVLHFYGDRVLLQEHVEI